MDSSDAMNTRTSGASMGDYDEGSDNVHPSAYTAPFQPRPQAGAHHVSGRLGAEKRGNLTADNLEQIPDADQVAPGIRLETVGNDFDMEHDDMDGGQGEGNLGRASPTVRKRDDDGGMMSGRGDAPDSMHLDSSAKKRFSFDSRASGSMDVTGRSNEDDDDPSNELYHDADDEAMEYEPGTIHERVGGSGATAENASKGTSVGHFGPLGEEIPGVPPHLDPRQPNFRPPSPSAASVMSVAVQPPVSPKMNATSAVRGGLSSSSSLGNSAFPDPIDSGEETESFDNGALTPTLSEDFADDDSKLPSDQYDARGGQKSGASPSYSLQRMNLDAGGTAGGGPYQVSFSPIVTSHHRGSVSSYSNRPPSIAATAGSSRAPSARGVSPPASTSRAGTTEGSSIEEYGSAGTGLDGGQDGLETPSVGRSRRSSYSAPSSEAADGAHVDGAADDLNNRARGSTLVPGTAPLSSSAHLGLAVPASSYGGSVLGDGGMDDDGPSLAPSEAGSSSTRSTNFESSVGHGATLGSASGGNSERMARNIPQWSSGGIGLSHTLEPPALVHPMESPVDPLQADPFNNASFAPPGSTGSLASPSAISGRGTSGSGQAMLPGLLAIKRAGRRQDSAPASTAATVGTASPPSSISVDGDFGDEPTEAQQLAQQRMEVPPALMP